MYEWSRKISQRFEYHSYAKMEQGWNGFFFAIIAKLRDEGLKEVIFDKHNLADLADYTIRANKDYETVISSLSQNILSISFGEKSFWIERKTRLYLETYESIQ